MQASLNGVYTPSEDVVAREIGGELIIVPLTSGIGDMEDELFSLNATGQAIYSQLDGSRDLKSIATSLATEYAAPASDIERDVLGLVEELLTRGIVVEPAKS